MTLRKLVDFSIPIPTYKVRDNSIEPTTRVVWGIKWGIEHGTQQINAKCAVDAGGPSWEICDGSYPHAALLWRNAAWVQIMPQLGRLGRLPYGWGRYNPPPRNLWAENFTSVTLAVPFPDDWRLALGPKGEARVFFGELLTPPNPHPACYSTSQATHTTWPSSLDLLPAPSSCSTPSAGSYRPCSQFLQGWSVPF